MRVAITRREPFDLPDGINAFLFPLAEALSRLGCDVVMISSYVPDQAAMTTFFGMAAHLPAVHGLLPRESYPARLHSVYRAWISRGIPLLKHIKPSIIIANGALPLVYRRWPHIFVVHDWERRMVRSRSLQNAVKFMAYRGATRLIATTSEIASNVRRLVGAKPACTVIPTCVRVEEYSCFPAEVRERVILHIGTQEYKNPVFSIEAMRYITTKNVRLVILGRPTDALLRHARSVGAGRVEFAGFVDRDAFKRMLATAFLVFVPSTYDVGVSSPTVLEAFASGTPVITTKGVSADIARNGRNCFVCRSPREFAHSADQLLEDIDLWRSMSSEAITTAREFSVDAVASRYHALIRSLGRGYTETYRNEAVR